MSSYHSEALLPAPDDAAIAHSERLIERIVARIEACDGVLPFDDYMQACLYEPGLGYYSAGSAKFGAEGDFVTAPELSPLFGRTLARLAGSLFDQGLAPRMLEFGGGSGRLCRDLLLAEPRIERYLMLEPSPDLRARQRALLQAELPAGLFERIQWLECLPEGFSGLVLGNEVIDALPVKVLHKQDGWRELGVGFAEGRFHWRALPAGRQSDEALAFIAALDARLGLPEGYATEVNVLLRPWLESLYAHCARAAVLLIDYGYPQDLYYHPGRGSGTLQCFYRHRVHGDPFVYPGLQDITAFVDFDALADGARAAGFALAGIATQAEVLLANGLLELAGGNDDDALERMRSAQQIKTLTLPGEMGDKFNCIGLGKDIDLRWPGITRE